MNNNVKINLHGQYRYSIIENDAVINSIPWSNNTILSSGLVDLYDKSIDDLLVYLDLGLSSSQPGAAGYGLSGVIANSVFIDIERDSIESYNDNAITRTFITNFTTFKSISSYSLNEFAIKRAKDTPAFARNTFIESLVIEPDQYINFEYKLSLSWLNTSSHSLPVTGNNTSYTYNLPVTTTNYNIPYYSVYNPNNYLLLLGDIYNADNSVSVDLPSQGENYPINFNWGIQQGSYSTFKPIEIYNGINQATKTYNVTTRYENISCPLNSGIFSNIKYALLLHNNDFNIATNKFNITKFAYPLTVYNQSLSCNGVTDVASVIPRYNNLSIDYNYSWTECNTSSTPGTCDINWNTSSYDVIAGVPVTVDNRWVVSNNGQTIRINVEDSVECGGTNNYVQNGIATATIDVVGDDFNLDFNFSGIAEKELSGYESIIFTLNDELLATATSPGGNLGCEMGPVISTFYLPPPYTLRSGNQYILKIEFTTGDNHYHKDAYYQADFTCSPV
jgi:hypothetical protein